MVADARKHIGEERHVGGEVFGIKHLPNGKVLVDFGDFYPRQSFTAVLTPEAYATYAKYMAALSWVISSPFTEYRVS